jgi:hypothetical protein
VGRARHDLPKNSRTALRGDQAADYGRSVLERAFGGRPSIDPDAAPGEHARPRVRYASPEPLTPNSEQSLSTSTTP